MTAALGLVAGWWLSQQVLSPRRVPAPRVILTPGAVVVPPARSPIAPGSVIASPTALEAGPAGPVVALVFDDAGGSLADLEEIIAIGRPVTVAVLPGLAYSSEVARRAREAGLEVLLHLPVEPTDAAKRLGPGGVTVEMDEAEIRAAVRSGLMSVPGAVGVNNHMGSRGTADRRVVRTILEEVLAQGLFFLDSVTTRDSVVPVVAAELGVRTAARTVFLDNDNEEEAIRREVRRTIALARARGEAIAIGHAQRLTPGVVASMLNEFDRAGIRLVPVSALVR